MYKTVRLYLRTGKREEKILIWYSYCYRIALYQFMEQRLLWGKKGWSRHTFSAQLAPGCRWHLTRCAKRLLDKKEPFRTDAFRKAGIWDQKSAGIIKGRLKLSFGSDFLIPSLLLEIADQQALEKLSGGEILRFDLYYDTLWYVNVILRKNDTSERKNMIG